MDDDLLAAAVRDAVRCCRAAGASREDAEDFAHDAVVQLLALIRERGDVADPRGWLTTAARRRMIDSARREQRERQRLIRAAARDGRDVHDPAEQVSDRALAHWLVADALTQLPDVTRQVCDATAAGLNPRQTAGLLGLSVRSVESHLTRARRWLRRLAVITVVPALDHVRRLVRDLAAPTLPTTLAAPLALTAAVTFMAVAPAAPPVPAPPTPVETRMGSGDDPGRETPDAPARHAAPSGTAADASRTAAAWIVSPSAGSPRGASPAATTRPEEQAERDATDTPASPAVPARPGKKAGRQEGGKAARQRTSSRPAQPPDPAVTGRGKGGAIAPGRTKHASAQADRTNGSSARESSARETRPNGSHGANPSRGGPPERDDRHTTSSGHNVRKGTDAGRPRDGGPGAGARRATS